MKSLMRPGARLRDSLRGILGNISSLTAYLSLATASLAWAQSDLAQKLSAINPPDGRSQLGIVVMDDNGSEVYAFNPDKPLKPASVLKILTSLAAISKLGSAYRYQTCLYESRRSGDTVKTIYIQGGGDPGFAIEDMYLLARKIWKLGIRKIEKIRVDDSLFTDERSPQGQRAYQTGSSALSFNYNSVGFDICPTRVGQSAVVVPDPWEIGVKLNGSVKTIASNQGRAEVSEVSQNGAALQFALGGTIGAEEGCAVMYRSVKDPPLYFAATLAQVLKQVGVQVTGDYQREAVPNGLTPTYCQESRPMDRVIQDLNHFSNNFIAEQILFALGADNRGRWSRKSGLMVMEQYVRSLGLWQEGFVIADGSGLSHENRISSRAVVGLLQHADQNYRISPEFETSLSISGTSGTLKKRSVADDRVIIRGKTGTLDGVSSLAGYVLAQSGRKFSFAILQNGVQSRQSALTFEDNFLEVLATH